jgi:hypothetical protein
LKINELQEKATNEEPAAEPMQKEPDEAEHLSEVNKPE